MPPLVDALNTDIFNMVSLTQSINKLPFKPARIGEMGLFGRQGVTTTSILIEEMAGLLAILPTARRGSPATPGKSPKRTVRSLSVPHIPHEDAVLAGDVQGVRAFGSENQVQGVVTVVNNKLTLMKQSHEVTLEYHRMGAIHGSLLDSDGTTEIYDLFTEFGVTEVEVDFALGDAGTKVRSKCLEVKRETEDALGAATYDHIHAFCGKTWFENFIQHEDVEAAFDRYQNGIMRRNDPRSGFEFAGLIFEEYRGTVSGVDFIDDAEARFFPVGVPNLFMTYDAPGDFMETANTVGLPIYAKQEKMEFDRGVKIHTQSNPLCICHRPKVLVKGV